MFDNNTQVLKDLYAPVPIFRAGDLASAPAGIEPDYAVYYESDARQTVLGFRDLDGNFFDAEGASTTSNAIITDAQAQAVRKEGAARSEAFEAYTAQVTFMPRVGVSFPVTGPRAVLRVLRRGEPASRPSARSRRSRSLTTWRACPSGRPTTASSPRRPRSTSSASGSGSVSARRSRSRAFTGPRRTRSPTARSTAPSRATVRS